MRRRLSTVIALVALVWAVPAAHAQHSDRNWLEHCRDDAQDDDRPRYCEERTMGAHATGGTITVDGGENGGARVAGWDRDSIDIIARVQTNAHSEDDAQALAKAISITITNGNIRGRAGVAPWRVVVGVVRRAGAACVRPLDHGPQWTGGHQVRTRKDPAERRERPDGHRRRGRRRAWSHD